MLKRRYAIFIMFLFLQGRTINAQSTDEVSRNFSIEPNLFYAYYPGVENKFNYGAGISLNQGFKSFVLSIGAFYDTQNTYQLFDGKKYALEMTLINLPIVLSIKLKKPSSTKKSYFGLMIGYVGNKRLTYKSVIYNSDNSIFVENELPDERFGSGSSVRFGTQYIYSINESFNLNAAVFVDTKFESTTGLPSLISERKQLIGAYVGLQFLLGKSNAK